MIERNGQNPYIILPLKNNPETIEIKSRRFM